MSKSSDKRTDRLVIGGPARANLLPPEVGVAAQGRKMRARAIALIVVAILIAGAAYAGAMVLTISAEAKLESANERTQTLLQEQAKYIEVRQVTLMLETGEAAKRVGTSTEIDWKAYLEDVQASLPSGTSVTNFRAETATPVTAFGQPTVPLQGDRIGELSFTATSRGLPDVQKWLNALSELDGFVDAAPGSITFNDQESVYEVAIKMHINRAALLLRFDEQAKEEQEQARQEREAAKAEAEAKAEDEESQSEAAEEPRNEPTPPQDSTDSGSERGSDSGTEGGA